MPAAIRNFLKVSLAAVLAVMVLAGCGGSSGNGECSVSDQNQAVNEEMEARYFWNDEPPQREKYADFVASRYASVDELLDFLRYLPDEFDRFFTSVTTPEEDSAFFGPGEFIGYGFSFQLDEAADELWISQVFDGSPASLAGFRRGLEIISVDGRTIAQIIAAGDLDTAFGASEIGVTQQFTLRAPGGDEFQTTATKNIVTIDPVPQYRVIDTNN